jgi:hypothetical protein
MQLNRAELIKTLRNAFGFRGLATFDLSETIIPVANIADLDGPPFHNKSGGISNVSQGAVAAQFSYVGLIAQSTTEKNFKGVSRMLAISSPTAMGISIGLMINSAFDAAVPGATKLSPTGTWDSVEFQASVPVGGSQMQTAAGTNAGTALSPQVSFGAQLQASTTLLIPIPFVISRGITLVIQGNTLNAALACGFYWDEYAVG